MKTQDTRTPVATEENELLAGASSRKGAASPAKDLQVVLPRRSNSQSMYSTDSVSDAQASVPQPQADQSKAKAAMAVPKGVPTSIFPLTQNPSTLKIDPSSVQPDLKSKIYYTLLINHFFIDEFIYSNSSITLPSLISLYARPSSFDISENNVNTFTLLFITVYTVGLFIGGVLAPLIVLKAKPSYIRVLMRLIIIACFILSVIKSQPLFLVLRFILQTTPLSKKLISHSPTNPDTQK